MINKILFTIFVIIAIWKGFSMLSKFAKSRESAVANRGDQARGGSAGKASPGEPKAVEMVPCPRCGAYTDPRELCNCRRS